jgi:branched-chain amino acid transport system ATP-binding protein
MDVTSSPASRPGMPVRDAAAPPGGTTVLPVLETVALEKRFGGIVAANGVSLALRKGARHALIGPNGAGKTTLVNLLTGIWQPSSGHILLEGSDITGLPPHQRVRRGIARTFQINQLFGDLTPIETVGLAVCERQGAGRRWWRSLTHEPHIAAECAEILQRFHLADVMCDRTGMLPYGKQRLLEIAVAIASRPRVLLLDEPAAGVPEAERRLLLDVVAALPADVTVLLIEHDMDLVFSFAERVSVLVNGALIAEGSPQEVARDREVRAAYLGQ